MSAVENGIVRQWRSRWPRIAVVLVGLMLLVPGCLWGVSANPFRLGNLPAGDIIRTHAKPPAFGYYRNFDPAARTLTVTPVEAVNRVRTQHIIVATVCDKNGNGRRNRRVEWHVSGVGHIVEVDESGFFPGRGYLVDDHYGVSYTNYQSHTLTRGNDDPSDDIQIKPGQTWCVITSAEEGDTHVTCYAPGIYDWEQHKVFAVKHWVDAEAVLPPSATNPAGQPHTLITRVFRTSDRTPAQGYRVRYRILDGPPAVLDPGGAQQVEVVSTNEGNALAVLRQVQPTPGANRISIEVARPGDKPTSKELIIARGEMIKTWVSPQLAIQKNGPPLAAIGQQITYQITVSNTGTTASRGVTIRDTLPPGVQLVGTTPQATRQGNDLLWGFGALAPQQSVAVQFVCTAMAPGTIVNCAEAQMAEGISGRSCTTTRVVAGALAVAKTGPATGVVGQPLSFQIVVSNRGDGPATNVMVMESFDPGLVHQDGSGPLQIPVGTLNAGESKQIPVVLTPRVPGKLCNRVTATADGGLTDTATHCVEVAQPQLVVNKVGPAFAFVGAAVDFQITVRNSGAIPATNVIVRDQLPPQLQPQQADNGGIVQGETVIWNLGTLAPNEQRDLRVRSLAVQAGPRVCNVAVVSADGVAQQSPEFCMEIRGIPAILTQVVDRLDPVPVEGETTYAIEITNQGSIPLTNVRLSVDLPAELQFVNAEGASRHAVNGQKITFEPFSGMPGEPGMLPKKRILYQVQAKALRPGRARVKVSVLADQFNGKEKPIEKEEITTIYDPRTGALGPSAYQAPALPFAPMGTSAGPAAHTVGRIASDLGNFPPPSFTAPLAAIQNVNQNIHRDADVAPPVPPLTNETKQMTNANGNNHTAGVTTFSMPAAPPLHQPAP